MFQIENLKYPILSESSEVFFYEYEILSENHIVEYYIINHEKYGFIEAIVDCDNGKNTIKHSAYIPDVVSCLIRKTDFTKMLQNFYFCYVENNILRVILKVYHNLTIKLFITPVYNKSYEIFVSPIVEKYILSYEPQKRKGVVSNK